MNTKIILPLFLASLMILSIIGFSLNSTQTENISKVKFNGYNFQQTDQGWTAYKDNQPILISQNPESLNLIIQPISLQEINSASKIYFTFNPEENLQALYYFDINIRPKLKSFIISCIKDSEQCSQLPLKTCKDASATDKIIQINLAEKSSLTYENNCLHIQGNDLEIQNLVDSLILKFLLQ
ncbi:MAG: hypothetical protein KKG75_03225 [Nanoarchaeota archaeon]|nr:hypothetical protein [Nanoarchaeota archaeon]